MKLTKAQHQVLAALQAWEYRGLRGITGARLSRILDKRFSDWAAPKLRSLRSKRLVEVTNLDSRAVGVLYVLTPAGLAALAEHRT